MDQTKDAPESSFAEAFEASLNFKTPEQGELLRGTIVSISGDDAYVSYGGPSEAVMAAAELEGRDVGDTVEGVVVGTSPVRISYKLAAGKANAQALRQAFESGIPVEGKITGRNKGGFDVNFSGVRAFCPLSQIELGKIENPDAHLNQTYEFRITEFADEGKKFVVSRAALLREQAAARAEETRKQVVPGAVLTGRVRTMMPFGAFVDLGGIDGLLHVSEMSRRRVNDPKDLVSVGQEVTVKVLKIEQDGKRISLSMKEFERDPWGDVAGRYEPGAQFSGRIARKTDFGFFVELEPGIDGLLHVSQLPPGMKPSDESLAIGSSISGWIREVDPSKRRISLALREVSTTDPWEEAESKYAAGRVVEGTVERAAQPGVFVQLEPGLTGLIPVSEMNMPAGGDPGKVHRPGERVQVKVLSIDRNRKRIALSHEAAKEAADRGEYLKYQEEARENEGKSAMALAFERAFGSKDDR
jgi:small subunit ribosomal protein S1